MTVLVSMFGQIGVIRRQLELILRPGDGVLRRDQVGVRPQDLLAGRLVADQRHGTVDASGQGRSGPCPEN